MFSIHSTGNSISAVRLLQSEDVHPDPGRQRAREVEVGVRSERAAPHPEEKQAEGAFRLCA